MRRQDRDTNGYPSIINILSAIWEVSTVHGHKVGNIHPSSSIIMT